MTKQDWKDFTYLAVAIYIWGMILGASLMVAMGFIT